jgi:hypothetical protein
MNLQDLNKNDESMFCGDVLMKLITPTQELVIIEMICKT